MPFSWQDLFTMNGLLCKMISALAQQHVQIHKGSATLDDTQILRHIRQFIDISLDIIQQEMLKEQEFTLAVRLYQLTYETCLVRSDYSCRVDHLYTYLQKFAQATQSASDSSTNICRCSFNQCTCYHIPHEESKHKRKVDKQEQNAYVNHINKKHKSICILSIHEPPSQMQQSLPSRKRHKLAHLNT
jgi:hypothetical protein